MAARRLSLCVSRLRLPKAAIPQNGSKDGCFWGQLIIPGTHLWGPGAGGSQRRDPVRVLGECGKSPAVAAPHVSPVWSHSVGRSSSTKAFKASEESGVPAARCLFKMIHRFIFSWRWEPRSHLLLNFKAVLVGVLFHQHAPSLALFHFFVASLAHFWLKRISL